MKILDERYMEIDRISGDGRHETVVREYIVCRQVRYTGLVCDVEAIEPVCPEPVLRAGERLVVLVGGDLQIVEVQR